MLKVIHGLLFTALAIGTADAQQIALRHAPDIVVTKPKARAMPRAQLPITCAHDDMACHLAVNQAGPPPAPWPENAAPLPFHLPKR